MTSELSSQLSATVLKMKPFEPFCFMLNQFVEEMTWRFRFKHLNVTACKVGRKNVKKFLIFSNVSKRNDKQVFLSKTIFMVFQVKCYKYVKKSLTSTLFFVFKTKPAKIKLICGLLRTFWLEVQEIYWKNTFI